MTAWRSRRSNRRLTAPPPISVDAAAVERLTENLQKLLTSDNPSFARRYLQLVIDKVVVDGRIIHVHTKPEGVASLAVPAEAEGQESEKAAAVLTGATLVPSSDLTWLRRRDSNPRPGG